jgi:two-component system cell cycle response regulator
VRLTLCNALSAREALALAFATPPDLVLLDLDLPDIDGFAVFRKLRADERTAHVPVLFLTGTEDTEIMAEAFELGAVDYVTKPFQAAELRARVRSALRTKRYQYFLATRAQIDGLTGLWNRAYFDTRLIEEMSEAIRHNHPLSIAIVDVDHFKDVNDNYGHSFGDQVLQAFSSGLQKTLRTGDVACRYGGEEFVLILRETNARDAMIAAERIRKIVSQIALRHSGRDVYVSASFGVASTDSGPERDVNNSHAKAKLLMEAADAALYRAKHAGRNRVMLGTLG